MDINLSKGDEPFFERHCHIQLPDAGLTDEQVLQYIARRFTYRSLESWQVAWQNGELHRAGEELIFSPPPYSEPDVDWHCSVLYEDEDLLAIDKSGNLPCHPSGRYFNHTLWALLKHKGLETPYFINRLDRETSGIVLVAKNPQSCQHLQRQFERRSVEKHYLALVEGVLDAPIRAVGLLAPDPQSLIKKKQRFTPSPDGNIVTTFTPLRTAPPVTLLDVHPTSGKLHQIRATLLAHNLPLVGDKLYGVDETLYLRFIKQSLTPTDYTTLRMPRQALHAHTLTLQHHQETLHLIAPLPDDMSALIP